MRCRSSRTTPGSSRTASLIVMAAINWAVTLATIVVFAHLLGQGRLRRPTPVPSPLANMAEGG